MGFIYNGNNEKVTRATNLANKIHKQIRGLVADADVKKFECANIGSKELAHVMSNNAGFTCEIKLYWYWSSGVLGKFDPKNPHIIWLNTRALGRSVASIVCTLWHERIHFLDHLEKNIVMGHDGNRYYKWKEQTAPYFVDYLAEKITAYYTGESQDERTDNGRVKYKWYWRLYLWAKKQLNN